MINFLNIIKLSQCTDKNNSVFVNKNYSIAAIVKFYNLNKNYFSSLLSYAPCAMLALTVDLLRHSTVPHHHQHLLLAMQNLVFQTLRAFADRLQIVQIHHLA